MTNKKTKALALGVLLLLGVSSCKDKQKHQPQGITSEPVVDEWHERDMFFYRFIDSVLQTQGYSIETEHREFYAVQDSINDIEFQNSVSGALERAVYQSGKKIANDYANRVRDELKKYSGTTYDPDLAQLVLCDGLFIAPDVLDFGMIDKTSEDTIRMLNVLNETKAEMCKKIEFMLNGFHVNMLPQPEQDTFINWAKTLIVNDMCNEVRQNRERIEKQYAKYFAGGMKQLNLSRGMGYDLLSYECGPNTEIKNWVTERRIIMTVPDSLCAFCEDTNATYNLQSLGNSKWCIVKKLPNGKMKRSAIFTNNPEIDTLDGPDNNPSVRAGNSVCDYWCGTLYYHQVIKVEKPLAKYNKPIHNSVEYKRLQQRYQKLQAEKDIYDSAFNAARNAAVTAYMARNKCGGRGQ